MTWMRRAIGVLLAGAFCVPTLARPQDSQTAYWTLDRSAPSSIKLYKNSTYGTILIRLTVCFDRYSASLNQPAPSVIIGQDPPVQDRVRVELGACSSTSYLVDGDAEVTLTGSSLDEGATASGSYQIAIP
jgi:hypothetical protein